MLKVQKSPSHQLPKIAWEASKNVQKTHQSKIACSSWMQAIEKWFGRWNAAHLLHDAAINSYMKDTFMQHKCISIVEVYTTSLSSLQCETGHWGTSYVSRRLCTLFPKQTRESKYHTLIQCSTFDHI